MKGRRAAPSDAMSESFPDAGAPRRRSVRERLAAPLLERLKRLLPYVAYCREWEEAANKLSRLALDPATSSEDFRTEMRALRGDVETLEAWCERRSGASTPTLVVATLVDD